MTPDLCKTADNKGRVGEGGGEERMSDDLLNPRVTSRSCISNDFLDQRKASADIVALGEIDRIILVVNFLRNRWIYFNVGLYLNST